MTPRRLSFTAFASGICLASVAAPAAAQQWQYSAQVKVARSFQMAIRSKFGETTYWATFIVTARNGRAWSRTIRVDADNWGNLTFPRDFRAPIAPGQYRYIIVVNGKIAIDERFRLK